MEFINLRESILIQLNNSGIKLSNMKTNKNCKTYKTIMLTNVLNKSKHNLKILEKIIKY